jgi:Asp-tRNA(Asn)/Glu-tRNA(Gln) amidotransferase A subunit family amidase
VRVQPRRRIAVVIAGRRGTDGEPTVLRIAYAYQQATDWHRRHPDLA